MVKCPSMVDWTKEMWHIHTIEYYTAIKNEFMSFVGTWMNLETIILSQLNKNRKTLHVLTHRQVLNNDNTWTQGGEHHILGSVGGQGRDSLGVGEVREG